MGFIKNRILHTKQMRRVTLWLIVLLSAASLNAQPFIPLLDTSSMWSNLRATGYPPNYVTMVTDWVRFRGDTGILRKRITFFVQSWIEGIGFTSLIRTYSNSY